MPNGISCAYFAVKNKIAGKAENNKFRDGISNVQSIRTADALVEGVKSADIVAGGATRSLETVSKALSGFAKLAKKIVYPLIVLSGIYDTARSDDKVKSAVKNTCAISTMFAFEQVAEKGLTAFKNFTDHCPKVTGKKPVEFALYALRGTAFAVASVAGYSAGAKVSSEFVDNLRKSIGSIKNSKNKEKADDVKEIVPDTSEKINNNSSQVTFEQNKTFKNSTNYLEQRGISITA